MSRIGIAALVIALLACGAWADEQQAHDYFLAGGKETLWMVRTDPQKRTFQLVQKQADGQWKYVWGQGQPGLPVAVVAAGDQLQLLFDSPLTYVAVDPSGQRAILRNPGQDWPSEYGAVVLTGAGGYGKSHSRAILAAVTVNAPRSNGQTVATTRPANSSTAPAGEAPSTSPTTVIHRRARASRTLRLFLVDQQQWERLGDLAGPRITDQTRIVLGALPQRIYVLLANQGEPNELWVLENGAWSQRTLAGELATGSVIELLNVEDSVAAIVASRPAEQQGFSLVLTDLERGREVVLRTLDNERKLWPDAQGIMAARLEQTQRIYLVWPEDGQLMEATTDLSGQLSGPVKIGVFDQRPPSRLGQQIMLYFMWTVLILILVPMFLIRPRTPAKPFVLPAGVVSSSLVRRLLAAVIDMVPIGALLSAIFLDADEARDFKALMNQPPLDMAIVAVVWLSIYVIYCTLMEWRRSATLGKMLLGLRVVGNEGARPALRQAMLRNLMKIIEISWTMGVLLLLPLLNRNRQRLGDIIAQTAVVEASSLQPQDEQEMLTTGPEGYEPDQPQQPGQGDEHRPDDDLSR